MVVALLTAACAGGGGPPAPAIEDPATPWEQVVAAARGQTVVWTMWQGDPFINAYVRDFVVPAVRSQFGITLQVVSGQGPQLTQRLMSEREAGARESATDLVWINGETFYQLRQIDALFGPFTARLPHARFIDLENPFIAYDFQQPVDGYECPWGNVQMALIYDAARTPNPPRTRQELAAWVKQHPGRFTFDTAFTGMTFLKALLIDLSGGATMLDGPFDAAKYDRAAAALWDYLRELKPYLWKQGETFPTGVAPLHQLFSTHEIDFTMSNNDGEVDNKVLQGLFPETVRAYVLDSGTIQNSHYIGIVKTAARKAGALVVANFLISPEAQFEKLKPQVWGDGTVLARAKLPVEWQARFAAVPGRRFAPPRSEIQPKALRELAPEYMIRLYEDFRKQIVER